MRISKLHIDQFRHLENLTFDFTYQSGDRKGQPLDKICFIGQSASGKTSLLELIFKELEALYNCDIGEYTDFFLPEHDFVKKCSFEINLKNKEIRINESELKIGNRIYEDARKHMIGTSFTKHFVNQFKTYYFKSNLISEKNISIINQHPLELIEKFRSHSFNLKGNKNNIATFSDEIDEYTWYILLHEILEYRKKFNQIATELIGKGVISDFKKFNTEIQNFQSQNPNPLEKISEKFDALLSKLNLEIETVNTEFSIPIKNKISDEVVLIQNASTGTQGLLLSFLPLFKLDTKDSIILIDEPERSLYPDMQMDIMEHYQSLAQDAQFIVATHSPFIAASFEPEERFILYFDEKGKVAVRRGTSPLGDDPNDILHNDFGINYINKYGQEKYNEYLDLKQKIYFEKDEKIKKEYSQKLEKLGEEYNF